MNLREKLKTAWENKEQIVEGFYNAYIESSKEIKEEALKRLTICRSNQCGFYDSKGETKPGEKDGVPIKGAMMEGRESCSICSCSIYEKTHCMACHCALQDVNREPLWNKLVEPEQEHLIQVTAYQKQEERNQQNQK